MKIFDSAPTASSGLGPAVVRTAGKPATVQRASSPKGKKVQGSLGVEVLRVGGGTWYKTPRRIPGVDLWLPAA
jgi:hypothetical protein